MKNNNKNNNHQLDHPGNIPMEKTRLMEMPRDKKEDKSGVGYISKLVAKITAKSAWLIVKKAVTYTLNILFTLLLVGIITGAVVGLAFLIYIKNYIDPEYNGLDNLRFDSSLSSKIYYVDESGKEIELVDDMLHGGENRLWAEYGMIPQNLLNAFVAVEDQRFFEHNGVDTKRTASAIYNFFIPTDSLYGGGSTITQQLIKNVTRENENTIQRKVQEIFRAFNVEEKFSKEEILEMYLNTIPLSQNTHGVRTAADTYFGKDLKNLSLVECAALASIAKSPVRFDPIINPKNNLERRNLVLKLMLEQEKISQEEFDIAYDAPLVLKRDSDTEYVEKIHSYYIDAVLDDVIDSLMETYGYDKTTASRKLYSGGLHIITCLDPVVQDIMEDVFSDDSKWPTTTGIKPQAAMVVMSPETGNILGIVGGRGEKRISRGLNRATQSKRQCGSAIKPLSAYGLAIDMGLINYGSPVDDVPTVYFADRKSYWPPNANRRYEGLVPLTYAIQRSLNTIPVALVEQIGIETVFNNMTENLGFTTLVDRVQLPNGAVYSDKQLSPLGLGSFTYGVTVREMTQAFNTFAAGGVFTKGRTFYEVRDSKGEVIIDNKPEKKAVYAEASAYIMTRLLINVTTRSQGTAVGDVTLNKSANFPRLEVAGKTGSTNDNKDNYFAGYTPDYTACCWFGYDNNKTIVAKGNPATKLWNSVMINIYNYHKENKVEYAEKFTVPPSIVTDIEYCGLSGKLATEYCEKDLMNYLDKKATVITDGVFTTSTLPHEYCDVHIPVLWDEKTKALCLPGCNCPEQNLIEVSLRKITDRAFVKQVRVTDAQFAYRDVPEGYVYPQSDVPFFQNIISEGIYVGYTSSSKPYNRICYEHMTPIVPPVDPEPDDSEEPVEPEDSNESDEPGFVPPLT